MVKAEVSAVAVDPRVIAAEQARILYMQAPISNATVMVAALLFYFILGSRVDSPLIGYWVLALYVTAAARLCLWYLRKNRPDLVSAETWLKYYLVCSGLVGVSWSLIYPLIYSADDALVSIALSMLIFGIVGGGVVALSVYLPAFFVYTYPQIFILIITLLRFEDSAHNLLALGALVYIVMTTLFTRNTNRSVLKSITLQTQNMALIDQLSNEVSQREGLVEQRTRELKVINEELRKEISERMSKEAKIRLLSQALEQSPVLVVITDINARIQYVNSTFERITGYRADRVIGRNPRVLKSGLTPAKHYQALWDALGKGQPWKGEIQNRKKNGDIFWEQAHIAPVVQPSGEITHYLAVMEDITEKKNQEEKILRQAHFDGLTNLPNRFLALDRLTQMTKESSRTGSGIAVLFLDLDGFKRVNDTLGHETGDRLLVQAAERLTAAVRDVDTVCRLGGDEFIILLNGLESVSDARPVAETLVSRFRVPFNLDERELVVTASIGIAVFPTDGSSPTELLRNADTAMYHSKEQGRNTYHYFTESMNQDVSRRLAVEEQLHGALGRREFSVLYQPLVDLHSGEIIGAEALLRWRNSILDQVSPDEFIPIAEQTGSIVEIGRYVLVQALIWVGRWRETQGSGFWIAVNLSPRQFRDPDLVPSINEALHHYGLPAESLELEITEGVLMSGHAYIERALSALNEIGVKIAMDDFGTGYSSLSYLRNFPFDSLKIDRSFISDITVDPADSELVNAAILMAHGLGLEVIAEGVETLEQLEYLREQGCEFAQGNIFSKPISAQAFSKLIENEAWWQKRRVAS